MNFEIVSEDTSSPVSNYRDNKGKSWLQLEVGGKYSIDVSAYSLPYGDVQYSVSPACAFDIERVNLMPRENRTKPYTLKLTNLQAGKCTLTLTAGQMGEGPNFYPETPQVLNIEVVNTIK
jgi:hypothetical protein